MASDKQQFERARASWESLYSDAYFSAPADIGKVAIICSYYAIWSDESDGEHVTKLDQKEIRQFRKEAFAIARQTEEMGKEPIVLLNAKVHEISDIMRDPAISDIVTVGHGTLACLLLLDPTDLENPDAYDWTDVVEHADHLKTGYFVQRHCGITHRELNVPLGMFAMMDARNIIAATGQNFEPRGLNHIENLKLSPVFDSARPSYRQVKAIGPSTDIPKSEET
jgi:hypothetical protein